MATMKQQVVTVAVNRMSQQHCDKKEGFLRPLFSRPTTSLGMLYNVGSG